jgi:hypothetical protein
MHFTSITRSIAVLGFLLLFLLDAFGLPALAQWADEAASPGSKMVPSKLSVSPTSLSYKVNFDKAIFNPTVRHHKRRDVAIEGSGQVTLQSLLRHHVRGRIDNDSW